jgi:FkbM family methyltransferase
MISHAQNAEDVVLRRAFGESGEGFYVDVGASSPIEDSVTLHFYEHGWRGVNIEPDPNEYEELVNVRERDVNLNVAVGAGGGVVGFFPSEVRGQGTVVAELAAGRGDGSAVEVPQVPLARIFEEHAPADGVDLLKVDVEGSEANVLESMDWRRWRPRVVVVEAVDDAGTPNHDEWEPGLLAAGYRLALFDGVNRFYCRDEDVPLLLERLSVPANVFDNWRPRREVAVQEALQQRLQEEAEERAETTRLLTVERAAHAETERVLAELERALAELEHTLSADRSTHDETRRALESVYESTSWRLTAPLRDVSRFARLMGWRRTPSEAGPPSGV